MKKKIERINRLLVRHFGIPPRKKKLPDPLDTLIGTILSQNTNDQNSFKAYKNLKNNFGNWEDIGSLKPYQIEKYIKIAGLGKQKSRTIYQLLNSLKKKRKKISLNHIKQYSDDDVLNELTTYKGIGVKTASCVLLFAMDRNICPVDTHVHRTLNRIGIVKTNNPDKTFKEISGNIIDGIAHSFHTNLIKLGREYCKPINPNCSQCPVKNICKYVNKTTATKSGYKKNNFMLLDNLN